MDFPPVGRANDLKDIADEIRRGSKMDPISSAEVDIDAERVCASTQGGADNSKPRRTAGATTQSLVVVGQLTRKPLKKSLNMDSALATSSVDAARVAAGIAYLAGKSCRARARCPYIVEML
jgi:hypothetical protein